MIMTIDVNQISRLRVTIDAKIVDCYCDNDIALGKLHDALMIHKGWVVDRMTKAHKEEEQATEMMKAKASEQDALE
jgi:hypothetical protein